jgi:hypothetical protein
MAQVRDTIELLVKVLNGNGVSKIKAESFRLAKFNNDTAVRSFYNLLQNSIRTIGQTLMLRPASRFANFNCFNSKNIGIFLLQKFGLEELVGGDLPPSSSQRLTGMIF